MRYRLAICFLSGFALAGTHTFGADLQSLLAKPPFEAAPTGPAAAATPTGPIEFRGMLREGNRWSFCIYDVQAKSSMWVGLQEKDPNQPFYVKSYDAAKETVQVEYAHSTYTLPLRVAATPTVASSPVATGPIPMRPTAGTGPMPMANVPTGSGPNFVPAGATDPNGMRDMRRMEQLAREAARLRAERARNLNSATAAGPTPAAPQKQ